MAHTLPISIAAVLSLVLPAAGRISVSVMLPLDTVTTEGINEPSALSWDLALLQRSGADSVMVDVWWGLVELAPRRYNWTSYLSLAEIVEESGLKLETVMSFHSCGGNVGDTCNIPIPQWARSSFAGDDAFYRDASKGDPDHEYFTLGVDHEPVFALGRTAVQMYSDFMKSFAVAFSKFLSRGVIDEVQVGLGPAGELRYPSYQLSKWDYCGIGEFQCSDRFMLADLAREALRMGRPEWGKGPPADAGGYRDAPDNTGFFSVIGGDPQSAGNFESDYGEFFLKWYSNKLIQHGDDVLAEARNVLGPLGVQIAAKVSGLHWWYGHPSHAAEATAGYHNSDGANAYSDIARMLSKHNATFDFTCLEMVDDPRGGCRSFPEKLVGQAMKAASGNGVRFSGENAFAFHGCYHGAVIEPLQSVCFREGFNQILQRATSYPTMERFTYLRLTRQLVDEPVLLATFADFASRMHDVK